MSMLGYGPDPDDLEYDSELGCYVDNETGDCYKDAEGTEPHYNTD